MGKSVVYKIFNGLVDSLKSAGISNIFLLNRPNTYEKMNEFAVLDLPSSLTRSTKGNDDFLVATKGVIEIAVKCKSDNTPNIVRQTDIIDNIMSLFPITDENIVCSKPSIFFSGYDKVGFQVTSIMFEIRTRINSYKN